MQRYIRIGVDIAKNSFQVHALESEDCSATKRKLSRSGIIKFLAEVEPCAIGMEACGSAHYWARRFRAMGHNVKLTPPIYVKAYVKRGKNDAADAAAICEAMSRPNMRFVAVKSEDQQATLMAHKIRELLIKQRLGDHHHRRSLPQLHLCQGLIPSRATPKENAGSRVWRARRRRDERHGETIEDHRTLRNGSGAKARPLDREPRVVGLHQGQRTPSAPKGRTYDRRPPAVHRRNKNACQGAVHI